MILVSNWEQVEKDDFYLSDEWGKDEYGRLDNTREARDLQRENDLFFGYIVKAIDYAIYAQMDSSEVLINSSGEVIVNCETQVIDNDHEYKVEYNY